MPVNFSNFSSSELENFKKFTFKYQAKDVDYIAQFLRDVIEALITVEVDKKCPNCNSEGMHVFIGKYNNLVAYQCNVCGHSQYSDGSKVEVGGLEFITEMMTNHVHLLLAPGDSLSGLAQLMKTLAARTTRYRNRLEGRSGTLWESRYNWRVAGTSN